MNDVQDSQRSADRVAVATSPWVGVGRAIGGAIIFSLPMMMTMEMWHIGFYINPYRLLILVLLTIPLFCQISSIIGFNDCKSFFDNLVDVFVAYAITMVVATVVLVAFGVITYDTNPGEAFTMVLLQAVPGSLGALLARSLIGSDSADQEADAENYRDELVILITGGIFLSFNMAPTEEMVLISYMMTPWHILGLLLITLVIMHMFAGMSGNKPASAMREWNTNYYLFMRFTCVGYLLAFCISLFVLWVFGRTDNESFENIINTAVVLSFPTGLGAAAARLII